MTTLTMTPRDGGFLLSEANGSLSRETVTIVSGAGKLQAGTVLGKITTIDKYTAYDNTKSDGSEIAVGVLFHSVDATSADQKATIITRLAEVDSSQLVWAPANDNNAKTAGLADLATRFIIARS